MHHRMWRSVLAVLFTVAWLLCAVSPGARGAGTDLWKVRLFTRSAGHGKPPQILIEVHNQSRDLGILSAYVITKVKTNYELQPEEEPTVQDDRHPAKNVTPGRPYLMVTISSPLRIPKSVKQAIRAKTPLSRAFPIRIDQEPMRGNGGQPIRMTAIAVSPSRSVFVRFRMDARVNQYKVTASLVNYFKAGEDPNKPLAVSNTEAVSVQQGHGGFPRLRHRSLFFQDADKEFNEQVIEHVPLMGLGLSAQQMRTVLARAELVFKLVSSHTAERVQAAGDLAQLAKGGDTVATAGLFQLLKWAYEPQKNDEVKKAIIRAVEELPPDKHDDSGIAQWLRTIASEDPEHSATVRVVAEEVLADRQRKAKRNSSGNKGAIEPLGDPRVQPR
ncbi:MAG: hypothetical protein R6U98_05000 [Pirellulaceae bacterium]